jgi:hypothetical protein
MRSCTNRTSSLAAVVMIDHDVFGSSESFGVAQPGERERLAIGEPVVERLLGLLGGSSGFCHSY